MDIIKPKALALDLDGTLLATDSLWEMFFKALSDGRLLPLVWLFLGRLKFKKKLAESTDLDLELLPWNQDVIDMATKHGREGGQVWLATAANEAMAKKVVDKFQFFSGYFASDSKTNLKSRAKAKVLVERFGEGNFIYAGDSGADIEVWKASGGAVVVGGPELAERAAPIGGDVSQITPVGTKRPSAKTILALAEPSGCLKDAMVFLPALMAFKLISAEIWMVVMAFLGFCFFTIAGNVLCKLCNLEKDRRFPQNRSEILPSGKLELSRAGFIVLGGVLVGLGFFSFTTRGIMYLALADIVLILLYESYGRGYIFSRIFLFVPINLLPLIVGLIIIQHPLYFWILVLGFCFVGTLGALESASELYRWLEFHLPDEGENQTEYNALDPFFWCRLIFGILVGLFTGAGIFTLALFIFPFTSVNVFDYFHKPYWGLSAIPPILVFTVASIALAASKLANSHIFVYFGRHVLTYIMLLLFYIIYLSCEPVLLP